MTESGSLFNNKPRRETTFKKNYKMFDKLILTLSLVNLLTNSAYSSIAPFYPLEAAGKGVNPIYIGILFTKFLKDFLIFG